MFFHLNDDIIEIIDELDDFWDNRVIAINYSIDSMIKGENIIFGSYDLLEKLLTFKHLEKRQKQYIYGILNHYNEIYSFSLSTTTHKVNVCNNSDNFVDENGTYNILLKDLYLIQKSAFSTENPDDYDFYCGIWNFIDNHYNRYKNCSINLSNEFYGGGTVKSVLERRDIRGTFILAFADSDKDFEAQSKGSTASALESISFNEGVLFKYILNFREKENLAPLPFYDALLPDELKKYTSAIQQFKDNEEFLRYVDLKDGYKETKIQDLGNKLDFYKAFFNKCQESHLIKEPNKDKIVLNGIGNKYANKVSSVFFYDNIEGLDEKTTKNVLLLKNDILQHIPEYIIEEWAVISNLLFDFGCCLKQTHNSFVGK